jgi:hypothetical protein
MAVLVVALPWIIIELLILTMIHVYDYLLVSNWNCCKRKSNAVTRDARVITHRSRISSPLRHSEFTMTYGIHG